MMRLDLLTRDLEVRAPAGAGALEVSGISHDSRRVEPGDLFVAIVGERFDGRRFAADAVAKGAVAVLGPAPAPADPGVPWLESDAPRRLLGPLSVRAYGVPHEHLRLLAVTGTNGKSTTVALLGSILAAAGEPAAVLGTLGYQFGGREYGVGGKRRTTPEAPDLNRALAHMLRDGAVAAAMEVSSHALELGRVDGLAFDLALFSNLTRDHLDFHRDMETYFASKRRLFDRLKPGGRRVVGVGDDWGRRLAAELGDVLRFSRDDGEVRLLAEDLDLDGIRARLATPSGELDVRSRLIGAYNLDNLLAAVAAAEALELPRDAITEGLAAARPLPGRLERVDAGQPFPVLIDYAHTPGALEATLRSLRALTDRKLLLVFGCGGERDRGKRPEMGRIAGELADLPVITSDNPRREDPLAIVAAVESGIKESGNPAYRVLPDRREAIRAAVRVALGGEQADRGWLLVVAGKGHESFQDLGDRVVPFSDRREIESALGEERPVVEEKAGG